ncbi:MAG: 30S ribosomal protein S11 [bacterium]|nr:30S ribosomal protein S11 [bacterium]
MGKKRIITKAEVTEGAQKDAADKSAKKSQKAQVLKGMANIFSSYNNTIISVSDAQGNVLGWSSAGSLGFKGAKKSTPYAATMVAKDVMEKVKKYGMVELSITVSGIGPGREAAIRALANTGLNINAIIDDTPIAHNGVRAPKPRRV